MSDYKNTNCVLFLRDLFPEHSIVADITLEVLLVSMNFIDKCSYFGIRSIFLNVFGSQSGFVFYSRLSIHIYYLKVDIYILKRWYFSAEKSRACSVSGYHIETILIW